MPWLSAVLYKSEISVNLFYLNPMNWAIGNKVYFPTRSRAWSRSSENVVNEPLNSCANELFSSSVTRTFLPAGTQCRLSACETSQVKEEHRTLEPQNPGVNGDGPSPSSETCQREREGERSWLIGGKTRCWAACSVLDSSLAILMTQYNSF